MGLSHGVLLGVLNVVVIGVGMAFAHGRFDPNVMVWVIAFGMVPGVVLGALLGWLADVMRALPIWLRRCVLVVPAVLLVVALAVEFSMESFIYVSCIPTAVAVLLLERSTRKVVVPAVPVAQARR